MKREKESGSKKDKQIYSCSPFFHLFFINLKITEHAVCQGVLGGFHGIAMCLLGLYDILAQYMTCDFDFFIF